jgi:predicted Zn-dependent protease
MFSSMRFPKVAIICLVVLSSFAANTVAPSKSELESMYDKAFRSFDANNYPEALQQLDAIDARQPDLAESQNLRGVIYMRQGIYDKAEAALYRAVELDPKFWNARFNLAEIPFLQKNWGEARNRFQALLASNSAELQGEATQLIQYKILLTYILEGKDNMVDSFLSKFELSNDTPAVQYGNAAIALQHKDEKAAKEWIAGAEKNFSPQLNKLFAESLYEAGWLQKPAGQTRAALELTSAAERNARTKAFAKSKLDQAQEAFEKRDLAGALKLLDEAEAADPNQPPYLNLRGEVLMEQKNFDEAEALFRKALKADPKFREAQFNLAQVPFKKKEYTKARDRLEALFAATPGGDKNQAAQLIKFKIFMTLLLEGKDSRAQKMMDQFQFTGDTPALYYAQAAWEFKHDNTTKANDWIASARKIYSLALNLVFADSFYDVGWLQNPASTAEVASSKAAVAVTESAGAMPGVEPSPIPGSTVAESAAAKESAPSVAPSASPVIAGMEATASSANVSPAPATVSQAVPVIAAVARSSPPAATASPVATKVEPASQASKQSDKAPATSSTPAVTVSKPVVAAAKAVSTPATVLAPAQVREYSPAIAERSSALRTLLVTVLLVAGVALLAWVIVPELRRRLPATFRPVAPAAPAIGPSFPNDVGGVGMGEEMIPDKPSLTMNEEVAPRARFTGGPPKRSLHLKASEPSIRRTVLPTGKIGRAGAMPTVEAVPVESIPDAEFVEPVSKEIEYKEEIVASSTEPFEVAPAMARGEEEFEPVGQGQPVPYQTGGVMPESIASEVHEVAPVSVPVADIAPVEVADVAPVEVTAFRPVVQPPPIPPIVSPEPALQQSTTPVTMPEPTQTPATRTTAGAPAPTPGGMQTAVQLTFSCEIASLQLTPSFKMGALQLRPVSKVVMMRLSPSQHPQPAMNLQITFEVATVQAAGGGFGTIRLTPSQQQKPGTLTSPAFTIAGVQLVSNFESAPVQITPQQQGKASVHMTAAFQISTVEFSPSFEIASIVLNASSKNVSVQLPGAGPSAIEGAPVFEVANMQVGGNGEIGLIQLSPPGAPRR